MNPTYAGHPMPVPTKIPTRGAGVSGRFLMIIIGLVVAVLIGVGLMLMNQDKTGPLSQRLTLRFTALTAILKDGQKNASSDKLQKITGEASVLLTGDIAAITPLIPKTKGKVPASLTAAEDVKPALERLKAAKINAAYDTAYTSELTSKAETTSALIKELYKATKSKKLKDALNTAYQHLAQTQKDLAAE